MTSRRSRARLIRRRAPSTGGPGQTGVQGRTALGLAGVAALLGASAVASHLLARRAERRNPPAGRYIDVEGVRLHVYEQGEGEPLVLLHGNGSGIEDFRSSGLVDAAAVRHRVIVFDRPGYGHSSRPRSRVWTDAAQADLLAAALHRMGVGRATVLGHSWGCSVAVALALRHPGSVAALVLLSGFYFPEARADVALLSGPAVPVLGDVVRYAVSPWLARLTWPLVARRIFAPAPVPRKFDGFPEEMTFRPSQIRASAAESALMIPDAFVRQRQYRDLTLPVAIVSGEEDRIVDIDAHSGRLHAELPHSTFDRVPGVGHMVHQTATERVLAAIERVAPARKPTLRSAA